MNEILEADFNKIDNLVYEVFKISCEIHDYFGPAANESIYQKAMIIALRKAGHKVEFEKMVSAEFMGESLETNLRVDILVDDSLVVELKSSEKLVAINYKQVITYLRFLKLPIGVLVNFGGEHIRGNFSRVLNLRLNYQFDISGWREKYKPFAA